MNNNKERNQVILFVLLVGAICVVASQLSGCGIEGPMGPAGVNGVSVVGPTGATGATGSQGQQGQQGQEGLQGPTGVQGNVGATGPTGSPGSNGLNCTVTTLPVGSEAAPNGGSLITCPDNTSSLVLNGTNGVNGATGAAGTVVAPVQLCPKQAAPSYGNWPEYGFCVDNELFALFEDSKGDLEITVLSSGTYVDEANNTTCTLTVNGCEVSQN